jgi:NADPH-dependent ferric siderophore reductase
MPLPPSVLSIPGVQPLEMEVVEAAELGAHMRRIVLTAPNLGELSYQPGQDVMLVLGQAGDRPLSRRYTIRSLDHARRLLELIIVSHGIDGPGARWAEAAEPGSRINGVGPRGKIFLDPAADWHLFLADASGAPASLAILEALPSDVPAFAFLELEGALPHKAEGKHTVQWLVQASLADTLRTFRFPNGHGHAYIAGEVQQVNALREIATQLGLMPEQVSAKAYWGRGKPNAPRGEPESS